MMLSQMLNKSGFGIFKNRTGMITFCQVYIFVPKVSSTPPKSFDVPYFVGPAWG